MNRTLAIVLVFLTALLLNGSAPPSSYDYNTILERELQKLTERGLHVSIQGNVVEAVDPISGEKWQWPLSMLEPREAAYSGLPTLTIDLRTLDTNQFNWKYHDLSGFPISTSWGFALPVADVDGDGHAEAYGFFKTPENDIRTRIYELNDSNSWDLSYSYATQDGFVEHITDIDQNGLSEVFIRLGDSLYAYEQAQSTLLPVIEKFRYAEWFGGNAIGIPGVLSEIDSVLGPEFIYRGSEPPMSIDKTFVTRYDPVINNLSVFWSIRLPDSCYGFECAGSIADGDFDSDGKREFVTSTFYGNTYIVEYAGSDSFCVTWSESLSVAGRMAGGDIDGNGIEEFFVGGTELGPDGFVHSRIRIFQSQGDDEFMQCCEIDIFPTGLFFVEQYQTVDIDRDGQKELLLSLSGGVLIIKGSAPHSYSLFFYKNVNLVQGISIGKVDVDSIPELLISRRSANGGWTEVCSLDTIFTDVADVSKTQNIGEFLEAFPNPFNSSISIRFELAALAKVQLKIFDLLGREVALLAQEVFQPGFHLVPWVPNNQLASGIYVCKLDIQDRVLTTKILYLK